MAWTWVRPDDSRLLDPRPLLDVGTGDAHTVRALTTAAGVVVGLDSSPAAFPAARKVAPAVELVVGDARSLPFRPNVFAVVLAADLFHHLDDAGLGLLLAESRRVLEPAGRLVSWWYELPPRPAPDAPKHPREWGPVAKLAEQAGFPRVERLALTPTLEPSPATVGLLATA